MKALKGDWGGQYSIPINAQWRLCFRWQGEDADFATKAIEIRKARQKKEADAAAAKRQREAEQRQQHLASILQRADTIWSGLDPLLAQKASSAYDQAAAQLQELRDAYAQAGHIATFQERLTEFRRRYSNRPGILRRIEKL